MDSIPLSEALFCAECEVITKRTADFRCPVCNSEALLDVGKLMGGSIRIFGREGATA